MQMLNLACNFSWHDSLLLISFAACLTGLGLLFTAEQTQVANELEETERMLFTMCFCYWIVYCVALGIQKICLPEWDIVLMSLKLTSALSYILTAACVLSLPLHRLAVRQVEE